MEVQGVLLVEQKFDVLLGLLKHIRVVAVDFVNDVLLDQEGGQCPKNDKRDQHGQKEGQQVFDEKADGRRDHDAIPRSGILWVSHRSSCGTSV
ncbi:hypothetical protein D3C75_1164100 [compost metagenome]